MGWEEAEGRRETCREDETARPLSVLNHECVECPSVISPPVVPCHSQYCSRGEKNRRLASSIGRIIESKKEIVFKEATKTNMSEC